MKIHYCWFREGGRFLTIAQTATSTTARMTARPIKRYVVLIAADVVLIVHWTDAADVSLGFLKLKTYELSAGTFQLPLPVWPCWLT